MTATADIHNGNTARGTLKSYVRYAERFGTELVFETAAGLVWPFRADLSDRQLGRLAVELRALDPSWRLPHAEDGAFEVLGLDGGDFAIRLVADGVPETAAARMAGVSLRTVQRRQRPARDLLRSAQQVADQPEFLALRRGVHATNPGSEGDRSTEADLSREATL